MNTYLEAILPVLYKYGKRLCEIRAAGAYSEAFKEQYELVTSADIELSNGIKREIQAMYPDFLFISEEEPVDLEALTWEKPSWVLDPIDGTVNFANGHHMVALSLALIQNRKAVVGAVYNPFLDEMFTAAAGEGAFCNGSPIHVKEIGKLGDALVATGFPYDKRNLAAELSCLSALLPQIRDIRRLGSAALDICWVASGRLQAYYEKSLKPWDVAAGLLIAREAGASLGHFGSENTAVPDCVNAHNLIVCSPAIYDDVKRTLDSAVSGL